MMFITHIIKTIEYFSIYGFPEITFESLPIIAYYWSKLIYIYAMNFCEIFK